ncbi:hypothetical protein, partial [Klebsiella pneumoniae]
PVGACFNGKIDRPRIHGRALPPAELRALVEALRPVGTDPDLIAAWDFSQGIATDRVTDLSANRCDGILHQ